MRDAKYLIAELALRDKEIADEEARHHQTMIPLDGQRRTILLELAVLFHGVRPGELVTNRLGKQYRVHNVDVDFCWGDIGEDVMRRNRPWVTGRLVKKDGTPGANIVNLCGDWELVK